MAKKYKLYLGGKWTDRQETKDIANPYDDSVVATVAMASKADFTKAIGLSEKAFAETRELPAFKREEICKQISAAIDKNFEKFAKTMSMETGKAITDARGEVARAVEVFKVSGEEAKRIGGDVVDLDWAPTGQGRVGLVRRFPKGVIAGISPFNFPLNLVCHKIGPAIASGNTIVLKPATNTPLSALLLAEVIDKTDLPKGAVSILPAPASEASPLLEDERIKLITFTGSDTVGWMIKEKAGKKEVVLELGGNAGCVVADDADLDWATDRIRKGGYSQAGQSCISVQRVYVQDKVYDEFLEMLKKKVGKLKVGDPLDDKTDVGTMIDMDAVENSLKVIKQAVDDGARVLIGGKKKGRTLAPTIITDATSGMEVCSEEAFAPLTVILRYKDFKSAVDEVNNSRFGLQAGIFTNRLNDIWYAFEHIDCGGIVINDVPTYRADHQPYGGMKDSGMKREGIRYTIEDMTDIKLLSMKVK